MPGSAPPEAVEIFGSRLELVRQFVELLADAGVERGLIGPRETGRLWDRHVLNCAALTGLLPAGATVADLGSGAGLPGVVLAIARPDVSVTLVEPLLRRATFLDEAVEALGLTNARVVRARAEELHRSTRFDVVTARALAPVSRLVGWAMPLVAARGELVAMKGSSAASEVAAAETELRSAGCGAPRIEVVSALPGSSTATVVRVAHADPARVS